MSSTEINRIWAIILPVLALCVNCSVSGKAESPRFGPPEPVSISGLPAGMGETPLSTEEPFLSRDGEILFFNTSREENNKDLHYAVLHQSAWIYAGEIGPGVNNPGEVEGNPTMDAEGHFFYIDSGRLHMAARGRFNRLEGELTGVSEFTRIPARTIDPVLMTLTGNMGVEVSRDGNTLYFSRAVWGFRDSKVTGIQESEIHIMRKRNGIYKYEPEESRRIMENINTPDLEYAASISSDDLELFFTRMIRSDLESGTLRSRIMHARRDKKTEPFGIPELIRSVGTEQFVEGPSVSDDGLELYYHQRTGKKMKLFRVKREEENGEGHGD